MEQHVHPYRCLAAPVCPELYRDDVRSLLLVPKILLVDLQRLSLLLQLLHWLRCARRLACPLQLALQLQYCARQVRRRRYLGRRRPHLQGRIRLSIRHRHRDYSDAVLPVLRVHPLPYDSHQREQEGQENL